MRSPFTLRSVRERAQQQEPQLLCGLPRNCGGYEGKRVVVGIGPQHRGAATVDVPKEHEVSITVDNPMSVKEGGLSELISDDAIPSDTIFPSDAATLTFTHDSNAEATCYFDRKRCPSAQVGTEPSS